MPRKKNQVSDLAKSAKFTEAITSLVNSGDFDVLQAERLMDKMIKENTKKSSE